MLAEATEAKNKRPLAEMFFFGRCQINQVLWWMVECQLFSLFFLNTFTIYANTSQ